VYQNFEKKEKRGVMWKKGQKGPISGYIWIYPPIAGYIQLVAGFEKFTSNIN
jgi:hypothetical protein